MPEPVSGLGTTSAVLPDDIEIKIKVPLLSRYIQKGYLAEIIIQKDGKVNYGRTPNISCRDRAGLGIQTTTPKTFFLLIRLI